MPDYKKYINSPAWYHRKRRYYATHEKRCTRCKSRENIHLHHRTYKRLGRELDEDLEPLCATCHMKHHGRPEEPKRPKKPKKVRGPKPAKPRRERAPRGYYKPRRPRPVVPVDMTAWPTDVVVSRGKGRRPRGRR